MAFSVHHNDYLKTHEDIKSSNMKKIEINLNVTGSHNVSISNEIDIFRMRIVLSNIQTNRFVYLFTVIVSIRDVRMNTKQDFITIRTSEQINRKKRLYFRFHFIPLWIEAAAAATAASVEMHAYIDILHVKIDNSQ